MKLRVGEVVKIKSYEEVSKQYPNEAWNRYFFNKNEGRIVIVREVRPALDGAYRIVVVEEFNSNGDIQWERFEPFPENIFKRILTIDKSMFSL